MMADRDNREGIMRREADKWVPGYSQARTGRSGRVTVGRKKLLYISKVKKKGS